MTADPTGWPADCRSLAEKSADDRTRSTTFRNESAFRTFYERTAPGLRSYLAMLTRDAALADDLLQDSFVRFLRAGIAELNEHQMKSYLYKTAASVARDHWRAGVRERRRDDQARPLPAASTAGCAMSHDLKRVFGELTPRNQSLLWLAYVEGFSHREIAEQLSMKESSVRVVLARARRRLAFLLEREGLGPPPAGENA